MRKLSTTELSILGITWALGPCTTYSVMKQLSSSGSTYYKSRAGTTYSVMDRLVKFGLVEAIASEVEPDERLVKVTSDGVQALQGWLTPPVPEEDIAHSADFVRLRMFFLGVVDPPIRIAFIENALTGMRAHLLDCEALLKRAESEGGEFEQLAILSVVYETRARVAWLEAVRERL